MYQRLSDRRTGRGRRPARETRAWPAGRSQSHRVRSYDRIPSTSRDQPPNDSSELVNPFERERSVGGGERTAEVRPRIPLRQVSTKAADRRWQGGRGRVGGIPDVVRTEDGPRQGHDARDRRGTGSRGGHPDSDPHRAGPHPDRSQSGDGCGGARDAGTCLGGRLRPLRSPERGLERPRPLRPGRGPRPGRSRRWAAVRSGDGGLVREEPALRRAGSGEPAPGLLEQPMAGAEPRSEHQDAVRRRGRRRGRSDLHGLPADEPAGRHAARGHECDEQGGAARDRHLHPCDHTGRNPQSGSQHRASGRELRRARLRGRCLVHDRLRADPGRHRGDRRHALLRHSREECGGVGPGRDPEEADRRERVHLRAGRQGRSTR